MAHAGQQYLGGREWQRGQRAARDSSWTEVDIGYFSFLRRLSGLFWWMVLAGMWGKEILGWVVGWLIN